MQHVSHMSYFFERSSGVKGETTNNQRCDDDHNNQKIRHRWHSKDRKIIGQPTKSLGISKISMHQWPKTAKKSRSTKNSRQWSTNFLVRMTRNRSYANVDIDHKTPISFFDDPSKKYFYYRCAKISDLKIGQCCGAPTIGQHHQAPMSMSLTTKR